MYGSVKCPNCGNDIELDCDQCDDIVGSSEGEVACDGCERVITVTVEVEFKSRKWR